MKKVGSLIRIVSLLLMISLVVCTFGVSAQTVSNEENTIISISECQVLAQYWIELYYDESVTVEDIIPIVDDQEIISFCVNFEKSGEPNGYIVVDADRYSEINVTEFAFSGTGIYETLSNNYGGELNADSSKMIYATGPFEYAISVKSDGKCFYESTNRLLDDKMLKDRCKKTRELKAENRESQATAYSIYSPTSEKQPFFNGFYNGGSLPSSGSYTSSTISSATNFVPSLMTDLVAADAFGGNCTPTAATNILSIYMENKGFSKLGDSRQEVYDSIVAESGWNQFGSSGMSFSAAKKGMKAVVQDAGYTFTSTDYWLDLWSDWTRDLGNGYPVLTAVYGYEQNDDGTWSEVGHSVVAIGYIEYESGARYLRMLDGWHETNSRYMYFDSDAFTSIEGMCIKVTK